MSEALKVGDVVKLMSGGASMTITRIDDDGDAWCAWFDDADELHKEYFGVGALKRDEDA